MPTLDCHASPHACLIWYLPDMRQYSGSEINPEPRGIKAFHKIFPHPHHQCVVVMIHRLRTGLFYLILTALYVSGDEAVYTDGSISSTWQDWSWGSTIDYAATDLKVGASSISVNSTAYSALSLFDTSVFSNFAGLKFDVAVRHPLLILLNATNVEWRP